MDNSDRMNRTDNTRQQQSGSNESSQNSSLTRRDDQSGLSSYGSGYDSPYELMRRFSEDVDRIFASLGFGSFGLARLGGQMPGGSQRTAGAMGTMAWTPSVDVDTRGDDLVVSADLPGVKPENVQIECDNNQLIIRGETKNEQSRQGQSGGYRYTERSYGSFYRSIPLPQGVNPDNASADFKNGVLEVTFPGGAKSLNPQRRRIAIGGGQQSQGQGAGSQSQSGSQAPGSSQTMQGSQNMGGNQNLSQTSTENNPTAG